jgi:hypothetical protein
VADTCTHLDTIADVTPSSNGCEDCERIGGLIRSYEPEENWWWCYPDQLFFEIDDAPPSPSHT